MRKPNGGVRHICYYIFVFRVAIFSFLKKLPVKAAKPATRAPMRPVTNINKYGLFALKINKETRCAKIFPLLILIHELNIPHNKKSATKPEINEARWPCGIRTGIIKATIAMLHQGKYKQTRKLKRIMSTVLVRNFMSMIYSELCVLTISNREYLFVYCCQK